MSVKPMPNPILPDCRAATVDDAENLSHIRSQCFHEHWSAASFQTMLSDQKHICLIIPDIAYILVLKIPPEAELITLAVVPEFRRQGIAERLLEQIIHNLKDEQIHTLHLEVNETLLPARHLYEKAGFQAVGCRPGYYLNSAGTREDAILMLRETPL